MKQQSALDRRQASRHLGTGKAAPAGPDATWMAFPIEPGQQQHAGQRQGVLQPCIAGAQTGLLSRKSSATGQGQPRNASLFTQNAEGTGSPVAAANPPSLLPWQESPHHPCSQQNEPGGLDGTSGEYSDYRGVKAR